MKQAHEIFSLSCRAAGAVTAKRFVSTTGGANAGADANSLGVAKDSAAAAGDMYPVATLGTAVVEAGAAIAAGAPLSSDSSGRAVTTDGSTYTKVLARALEAASGAGKFIEVHLIPN